MAVRPSLGARIMIARHEPTMVFTRIGISVRNNSPGCKNALCARISSAMTPPVNGRCDLSERKVQTIERLRVAHEKITARLERQADTLENRLLHEPVEVDHNVPAKHY